MQEETAWIGKFSPGDHEEINALRAKQVSAIENSNASAYSDLCTDDILLMLQGNDVVVGKENFYKCESKLFQKIHFELIVQIPIRVERQGNLAIEVGGKELAVTASDSPKDYKSRRKYSHVMRKIDRGWRFAVLMSNNSE
jgi:uncharacterized protein (TIGR02246 family)